MIRKTALMTAVLAGIIVIAGMAQTGQISASGSYLKGTGDNKASLWGGGLAGKAFIGSNFAVGAVVHAYPKKTSSIHINNYEYRLADLVTNAAATFDFLLADKAKPIQPYIGADAGVSFNNQSISYTSSSDQLLRNENKQTYFLLSPKLGVNIGLGQAFGIFAQAAYNFTFGDGESVSINDVPNPFKTEPVSKYLTFDAGVYFRFMPAK